MAETQSDKTNCKRRKTSGEFEGRTLSEFDPALWETLPSDLVVEILSKVPNESLWNFRTVSKDWKSVISPIAVAHAVGRKVPPVVLFTPLRRDEYEEEGSVVSSREGQGFLRLVDSGARRGCGLAFTKEASAEKFDAWNPFADPWTTRPIWLPSPRLQFGPDYVAVSLFRHLGMCSYKFVASKQNDAGQAPTTLVYDSGTCSWKNQDNRMFTRTRT